MGKIYACSDIHGQYEKYMKLWDVVKDEDELFIIGDVIDRGPDGMRILTDIMTRKNVTFIIGNHETMMYQALFMRPEDAGVSLGRGEVYDPDRWFDIWIRSNNGGMETYKSFDSSYRDRGEDIAEFLRTCPVMAEANVEGKRYALTHGMPDMTRMGEKAGENLLRGGAVDPIVWDSPFDILENVASMVVKEGRAIDTGDRMNYPLMDIRTVPAYMKPPIDRWEQDVTYIVGHVIVQRFASPRMIHMTMYDIISDDEKTVEFLDIDGGLAAYRNFGQGGLLDSLALILYSLTDDRVLYL
ncbi:MAG: fructose-bisphosphatase class III [Lachnospiraceae bacterium]|nr:fructose-bisphosphatase class III [Lachnospiraceae bacterium]